MKRQWNNEKSIRRLFSGLRNNNVTRGQRRAIKGNFVGSKKSGWRYQIFLSYRAKLVLHLRLLLFSLLGEGRLLLASSSAPRFARGIHDRDLVSDFLWVHREHAGTPTSNRKYIYSCQAATKYCIPFERLRRQWNGGVFVSVSLNASRQKGREIVDTARGNVLKFIFADKDVNYMSVKSYPIWRRNMPDAQNKS